MTRYPLKMAALTAALAALPLLCQAGTVTFAEYDGMGNDAAIPADPLPSGLPDNITATWTGFALHTNAGDTPMSIFTVNDSTGDDAVIRFSGPVVIKSINVLASTWGSPMSIVATRWGKEVWRYTRNPAEAWEKTTIGSGKEVDTLVFEGKWNHFDDIEVEAAPDADGDGYTDADETATGHNPNDQDNNPTAQAIADSIAQFTTTGTQGENDWFYGYRNLTADGGAEAYDPATMFIPFTAEQWNGGGFAVGGNPPWTSLNQRELHPNTGANAVHWVIRRWTANQLTKVTPLAIRWHTHHQNVTCGGNGVTGAIHRNGQVVDKAVIAAPDGTGVTRTYYLNVAPGDHIDLILSPKGTDGIDADSCDGSQNWFLVDPTIPADPRQPDGSIFVPVGSGDTDADNLPDVWEKIYFPSDLAKLGKTGDYDNDGSSDLKEYENGSDPTKPDTDGDGLNDGDEAAKGTSPTKADTDGDGLTDSAELSRTPPTDPKKGDTDADSFSDSAEIAAGSDPVAASDTPMTYVIANSQTEFSGVQGKDGWFFGYRVYNPTITNINYNAGQDFVRFPGGQDLGDWDGTTQTWTGQIWDLNTGGAGPWTEQGPVAVHPNGANSPSSIDGTADPENEQWVVRRWTASELKSNTPATIIWSVRKTNLNNDGVTGLLFINGTLVDSKAIAGNDGKGEVRRYRTTLKSTDIVDLALSPEGPSGDRVDWSDGSETWFWVDTRPVVEPVEIRLSGATMDAAQGKFTLKWNSKPGTQYAIWTSANLTTWTPGPTVDSAGAETTFTDTLNSPQPQARFYRVSQQ